MYDDVILKFIDHLEQNNTDCYHQSNLISNLKSFWKRPTKSTGLQCGLSAGKLELVIILV